jgi:hypothetical protein
LNRCFRGERERDACQHERRLLSLDAHRGGPYELNQASSQGDF